MYPESGERGHYSHAAIWVVLAFAELGMGDKAGELFHMLNPVNHARTDIEYSRYKVEPYVIAADIYAAGRQSGRAAGHGIRDRQAGFTR